MTYSDATPFAFHASQAFGSPTGFFAYYTFRVGWQIALAPMMLVRYIFAIGYIKCRLTAVINCQNLTITVNIVFAD